MSTFGLDYVSGPPVAAMKAAGVAFVCRYLSEVNAQTQVKLLTADEAKMLSEADISIVSNYEWYAERPLEGEAAGIADAKIAESQHVACGGPSNRPIYFSVDIDVSGEQVADYFRGVASVIGKERTGAYSSYRVLHYLFDNDLITWGWQTYAWSAGQWEPRAQLQQYQDGAVMAGHSVDYNRSMTDDFGQWRRGGTMGIPTGWKDENGVLTAPNGIPVVHGFREHVLANGWHPENWPLMPEYGTPELEYSNSSLGGGTQQVFRWTMLGYTQNRGVFFEWLGVELLRWKDQLAKLLQLYQADEAKLKEQPASVDSAELADMKQRLSVISGLAAQGGTLFQQIGTAATVK